MQWEFLPGEAALAAEAGVGTVVGKRSSVSGDTVGVPPSSTKGATVGSSVSAKGAAVVGCSTSGILAVVVVGLGVDPSAGTTGDGAPETCKVSDASIHPQARLTNGCSRTQLACVIFPAKLASNRVWQVRLGWVGILTTASGADTSYPSPQMLQTYTSPVVLWPAAIGPNSRNISNHGIREHDETDLAFILDGMLLSLLLLLLVPLLLFYTGKL